MASFNTAPAEVVCLIVENISDPDDLDAIFLTSKGIRYMAARLLGQHVDLKRLHSVRTCHTDSEEQRYISLLVQLVCEPKIARYIKCLKVGSLHQREYISGSFFSVTVQIF